MRLSLKDVRDLEVQALLSSCITSRKHNALQESLAAATYLSDLAPACLEIGLNIDVIAQNEVADVLWDQGEHATSIRMLKGLAEPSRLRNESTGVHKAKLLAKLVSN
jgi:ataxia telangiectasia mutated family protein